MVLCPLHRGHLSSRRRQSIFTFRCVADMARGGEYGRETGLGQKIGPRLAVPLNTQIDKLGLVFGAIRKSALEKCHDDAAHLFVEGGTAVHLVVESGAIEALGTGQIRADGCGNGSDEAHVARLLRRPRR